MKNVKIKVLQYMYGNFEYFPYSEWINRRYCERHGYQYVLRRDMPRTDRHLCWHKIPVILDELKNCDYLLFLDADAVFYSHELTVENELLPEMQGKSLLMAQDCGDESYRWHPGYPNSGVILMKNDEKSYNFTAEWNAASEIDEETRWKWPPDQLALWRIVLPKYKNYLTVHPEYYLIQGRLGQYIRHYCLCIEHYRTMCMKAIYQRLSNPR